jgi:hypothetical protein
MVRLLSRRHDEGWQNFFVAYPYQRIAAIFMSNSANFDPLPGVLSYAWRHRIACRMLATTMVLINEWAVVE